jgi:alpha-beta hydrolase superfamily lysophospholipase
LRPSPIVAASLGSFLAISIALTLSGQPRLTAVMYALPLLVPAAFPLGWWRWRWSWGLTLFAAAAAAHPAVVMAGIEASRASGAIVWSSALAKAWGLMGLGLCLLGLVARFWTRWPRWWARLAVVLIVPGFYPLISGPMQLVYRPQVTCRTEEYPEGRRWLVPNDGVVLDTLLLPPIGRSDPRGVVLFVHGVGRWKEFYRRDITYLRQLGWSVLCFDLRGHGASSMAPCTYGAREVGDMVAEWRQAQRIAGGRPIAAYGVSLGGAILLQGADQLDGCACVIAESAFADLAPLVDRNLKPPALWVGIGLCELGLGWSPLSIRPEDAPIMRAGPPLLLGMTELDRVIPPDQGRRLAAHAPRARTVVSTIAVHAGMVRDDPQWREAVAAALQEAERRGAAAPP